MHFWEMLKFEKILKSCDFSLSQIELAEIAILGRLISPGSEKHTVWWFNKQSSLAEFLQLEKIGLGKDRLYRIGDKLLEHKSEIERSLRKNLKSLHTLIDRVYLYDLTNTYFEGNKLNSTLCKRGKSKEKRDDCPLVTLALVVDQDGFPVFSKIYSGNQSEPLTLQEVLAELKDSEDFIDRCATPAIVMDRGIATKDNILLLEQEGYKYFVIERRNSVKEFAQEFKALEGFSESKDKHQGKLYLKKIVSDTKARVLVYSEARAIKERGITTRWEKNFLEDIKRLNDSIQKGNISTADKIWVKIGRLKEKYGSTAANYEIQLQPSNSAPQRIESLIITDRHQKSCKAEFPGCYVIETNHTEFSAEEIWKFYMNLSEVEAAFRSMKTELGTRPIYHQKDGRIEVHLFYSVLAYAILKSITYKLALEDVHISWQSIKQILQTHMRSDIMFNTTNGYRVRNRQTAQPEAEAKKIYSLLNIKVSKNTVSQKYRL